MKDWNSHELVTYVAAIILKEWLGYNVELLRLEHLGMKKRSQARPESFLHALNLQMFHDIARNIAHNIISHNVFPWKDLIIYIYFDPIFAALRERENDEEYLLRYETLKSGGLKGQGHREMRKRCLFWDSIRPCHPYHPKKASYELQPF